MLIQSHSIKGKELVGEKATTGLMEMQIEEANWKCKLFFSML